MINTVLITGAEFNNKGAQSMLFVTIDEVRKRFPDSTIYFETRETVDVSKYKFDIVNIDWRIMEDGIIGIKQKAFRIAKDCILLTKGRRKQFCAAFRDAKKIKDIDIIIDISGFAIGDKWSLKRNKNYLRKLKFAKEHSIPFYIMPQSIGPFSFEKYMNERNAEQLRAGFSSLLQYPQIIYARERDGVNSLKQLGITGNVTYSPDLVLQSRNIDLNHIFKDKPSLNRIDLDTGSKVALVPNKQCLKHGDENRTLDVYKMVIDCNIEIGKQVYIIRHSENDEELCRRIYNLNKKENIYLIDDNLSCLEYDYLIKQFDYVCGSRFHGLVHALRNDVPCIALGWSVKYKELLELVGLESYVFDITKELSADALLYSMNDMNRNLDGNRERVRSSIETIQKGNCFSFLDKL